jgi:phosphatidylserine decarboxylase
VRSNKFNIEDLQDDGGLSSDTEASDDEDEFVDASDITPPPTSSLLSRSPAELQFTAGDTDSKLSSNAAALSISVNSPDTPTSGAAPTPVPNVLLVEPTPKANLGFAAPTIAAGRFNPRNIVRKLSGLTGTPVSPNSPVVDSPSSLVSTTPPIAGKERRLFGKKGSGSYSSSSSGTENTVPSAATPTTSLSALSVLGAGKRKESHYEYKKAHDIVGIAMLEIQGADNLPKWANSEQHSLPSKLLIHPLLK